MIGERIEQLVAEAPGESAELARQAAAAAKAKAAEMEAKWRQSTLTAVLHGWLLAAKAIRKERHAGLVARLLRRMGNNTLMSALEAWKAFLAQILHARQVELESASSTRIQSCERGRVCRCEYRHAKLVQREIYMAMLNKAASKIQSNFRGTRDRRRMKTRKPGRGELRPTTPPLAKLATLARAGGQAMAVTELSAADFANLTCESPKKNKPASKALKVHPAARPAETCRSCAAANLLCVTRRSGLRLRRRRRRWASRR